MSDRHAGPRQSLPAPHRPRRTPTVVLAVGAEITVDDRVVGTITSSAPGIALGFVRREVDPPAPATVDGVSVTVTELPSEVSSSADAD